MARVPSVMMAASAYPSRRPDGLGFRLSLMAAAMVNR